MSPYEIWITGADGSETLMMIFFGDLGLNDADAKTAAAAVLQDMIDKIAIPSPDTIAVKKAMIYPPSNVIRQSRAQDNLE